MRRAMVGGKGSCGEWPNEAGCQKGSKDLDGQSGRGPRRPPDTGLLPGGRRSRTPLPPARGTNCAAHECMMRQQAGRGKSARRCSRPVFPRPPPPTTTTTGESNGATSSPVANHLPPTAARPPPAAAVVCPAGGHSRRPPRKKSKVPIMARRCASSSPAGWLAAIAEALNHVTAS